MTVNPRLAELIESGELDLEDERQREMWLRTWASWEFSAYKPDVPQGPAGQVSGA